MSGVGGGKESDHQCGAHGEAFPSVAGQARKDEASHGKGEGPLEALDGLTGSENAVLCQFHGFDSFLENLAGGLRTNRNIKTTRGGCDFHQPWGIEFGVDGFTGRIADKVLATILSANADERSLGRADAYCENPDSFLGCLLGCGDSIRIQFLAVCQNDESPRLALSFSKGLTGRGNGCGQICATYRNDIGIQFLEGIGDSGVVESQRCL